MTPTIEMAKGGFAPISAIQLGWVNCREQTLMPAKL
jgi:hypothetical protein